MLKKINTLIFVSIIGLIALSFIQGYLIENTYQLKKKAFIKETEKTISHIDDYSSKLDSIEYFWQDVLLQSIENQYSKGLEKAKVLERLKEVTDSMNPIYVKQYNIELAKKNLKFPLKFHKTLKEIILFDSIKSDTLFKANKLVDFHLLGGKFNNKESHKMSSSLWKSNHEFDRIINEKKDRIAFSLHVKTEDYMNVYGWKNIIFSRMKTLLIISFLIFTLVIGLLYYSIKNLITQKKIADIKTDFVNNIKHELKTPLATLSIATKMLKNDTIKGNQKIVDTTVKTIERQNTRLHKLIDQVLTNSMGYHEIELQKERVKSTEYFNILLDDFLLSVNGEKVLINRNLKDNKEVLIDKFYLTTALFNLLENAVKYTEEDVIIDFSSEVNDALIISIKDNGIGISPKEQQFVFDKFFRAGNKEVHNVKGLGLGLYYTLQIIKAHQGEIEVAKNEKGGAKFIIKIPLNL